LLNLSDTRYQREVIVTSPHTIAFLPPSALVTLLPRMRVCRDRSVYEAKLVLKPSTHKPVVRGIIKDPMRLDQELITGDDHVHPFRENALCGHQEFGVQRELQYRCPLCLSGQLAIVNFIGKRAK
jgi:hypothetical protein